MKVILYARKNKKHLNITQYIARATWEGSVEQASRTLTIDVLNASNDRNIKNSMIKKGDLVTLIEDDKKIFLGQVTVIERKSEAGTVTYTCRDFAYHLLQSKRTYSFKNTTAEKIVRKVCNDIQLDTGSLAETKVTINKLIMDSRTLYEIIMGGYTKASRSNGEKYILRMDGKKVTIVEVGKVIKNYKLSQGYNITSSSYTESIDNIINQVVIYDENNKKIGEVRNDASISEYGVFQDIYTKEKGINAKTAAKRMLESPEKEVTVEIILPTLDCISGNGINVYDKATKLTGLFWIQNDSHVWENGVHTANLTLSFKKIMDAQEESDEQKKKQKAKKHAATGNATAFYTLDSKKYHSSKKCCDMKKPIETTVAKAIRKGKEKCKKCWK